MTFPLVHNRRVTRCLRQENIVPLAILRQAIYATTLRILASLHFRCHTWRKCWYYLKSTSNKFWKILENRQSYNLQQVLVEISKPKLRSRKFCLNMWQIEIPFLLQHFTNSHVGKIWITSSFFSELRRCVFLKLQRCYSNLAPYVWRLPKWRRKKSVSRNRLISSKKFIVKQH